MTRDIVFVFLGGAVLGATGAVTVMRRLGYSKLTEEEKAYLAKFVEENGDGESEVDGGLLLEDRPSYNVEKTADTRKVRYDNLKEKPPLEELVKKYEGDEEEDIDISEDGEEEEDGDPDPDLAYADEYTEDDVEYGTVIKQIPGKRKDQLIFLVPEECAGELYLLEELTYYAGDDVLVDVTDMPVDDPLLVIGDSLDMFGQCGETEDMMFIRNCTLGIEYEVTRVESRWADRLYGVKDEAKPKKTKMPRREEEDDV